MDWVQSVVLEPSRAMFTRIWGFVVPELIVAIVVLILGWWIARIVQELLVRVLKGIRLDDGLRVIGIPEILQKGEIKYSASELLGVFAYWLVILATLLSALNVLHLTITAELLERAISYVPNVLAGVIILVLGLFFATMLGGVVQTAAANAGISQAKALGQVTRTVVVIFAIAVALEKFFSSVLITTAVQTVVMAVALAFALAFGLGCKEIAGRLVGDFVDKIRRR